MYDCCLHAFMQYGTCNASSCACVQGSCPHRGISTLVLFIHLLIFVPKQQNHVVKTELSEVVEYDTYVGPLEHLNHLLFLPVRVLR